jgi:hypothetical protein
MGAGGTGIGKGTGSRGIGFMVAGGHRKGDGDREILKGNWAQRGRKGQENDVQRTETFSANI